ncbi:ABC transporter permease [Roseococcus suduntuyensis]|uniref:Putative ABC transport system permease protein n=1 Tax=Roseococcus suduntuyensis TaxID=455361 RepID=A0A840AEP8_9PROT|nr:ABC transporter permease [Roseococcus suduntuyensis]MBB3899372.1 putative ABC transport system permease protein [Roseococcus suduntuyensis]
MNAPHLAPVAPPAVSALAPLPRGRGGLSFTEALSAALGALNANKLRAALTALGIFIGVAAVMVTVAVGAGARQQVLSQIQSLGANLLLVWGGNVRMGGVSLGAGQRANMSWDDAQAIPREIYAVQVAAGAIRQQQQVVAGNQNWATTVTATDPDWFVAHDWTLAEGRFFTVEENMAGRKVVLLGATVAEALFGEENPVGREVRIGATPFEVIGVLGRKGQNPMGQDQDDAVVMPYWTARRSVMGSSRAFARAVSTISVKVHEGEDMALVEDELRALFRQRHRVAANEPDTVQIRNLSEIAATRDASARTLSMLLASVAAVSLLVGGIGVMNIMLVSVTERTKEIGLRLAVGARPADILKQFLLEAVLLALIGGAAGVAAGFALAHLLGGLAGWPVLVQWDAVALAVAVSGLTGLFFGYWPARRAARLDPIAALRSE